MPQVLIVEDNRALAMMAQSVIQAHHDFEAVISTNRKETDRLISTDPSRFTAAIVDINLPDAPNGEVIPDLLASNIPVIVMTGSYGEELRQKMSGFGIIDYVVKHGIDSYQYASELVQRIHRNRSTKVLIVEDSRSEAAALQYQLEIQRFQVLVAHTGEEALEILTNHPDIRLIFADYNMPGMNGFNLSQTIRKTHGKDKTAIIGLSSTAQSRVSSRFLKSGANDFLAKPFAYEELLCRVNQNMELLDLIELSQNNANHDYLTKLYNRRYFFEKGRYLYEEAKQAGSDLCIAMLDIDYFKKVNDVYGHERGDAALKQLANLLMEAFSDSLVARFGGEEFCILIQDKADKVHQRLDAFRKQVEKLPIEQYKLNFFITVSIGFTDQVKENLEEMLVLADAALYLAKENGRNCVVYSSGQEEIDDKFKINVRVSGR